MTPEECRGEGTCLCHCHMYIEGRVREILPDEPMAEDVNANLSKMRARKPKRGKR